MRGSHNQGEWFKAPLDVVRQAIDQAVAAGGGEQAKRHVGRKKLWAENVNLTLPEGAKARMDAALREGEDRLDLIREAIERELKRRQKVGKAVGSDS